MILPTDIPTRAEIDRLLDYRAPSSVSIYLPTDPASNGEAERIELKTLAGRASSQLRDSGAGARVIRQFEEEIAIPARRRRVLALPGEEPGGVRDATVADHVPAAQPPAQPGRGVRSLSRKTAASDADISARRVRACAGAGLGPGGRGDTGPRSGANRRHRPAVGRRRCRRQVVDLRSRTGSPASGVGRTENPYAPVRAAGRPGAPAASERSRGALDPRRDRTDREHLQIGQHVSPPPCPRHLRQPRSDLGRRARRRYPHDPRRSLRDAAPGDPGALRTAIGSDGTRARAMSPRSLGRRPSEPSTRCSSTSTPPFRAQLTSRPARSTFASGPHGRRA